MAHPNPEREIKHGRCGAGAPEVPKRPPMDDRKRNYSQAGGSILAIAIIGGTVAGVIVRQPSIGFLIGTGAGLLMLAIMWLRDRRRLSGHPTPRPDDAADKLD
jgi:hypothetical protein